MINSTKVQDFFQFVLILLYFLFQFSVSKIFKMNNSAYSKNLLVEKYTTENEYFISFCKNFETLTRSKFFLLDFFLKTSNCFQGKPE